MSDEAPAGPTELERERYLFRWSDLPLVTADLPGTGGDIRVNEEDFQVEEIPAYLPQGEGNHLYLKVEKRGLTTRDLVVALTRAGVPEAGIGVAGLKDKAALTVQWLSLPRQHQERALQLEAHGGVRVLERGYHRNKLGLGHLKGNRFRIVVRGAAAGAERSAAAVLAALAERGAPNWFGPQRFGRFASNAFDGIQVLRGLAVPGGHRLKRFFVSALQSLLFNAMLADRIGSGLYRTVVTGDWARKHDTGGTFQVEDEAVEAPRAHALQISATLPLFGRKVRSSGGKAGAIESRVLERYGLAWTEFTSRRGDRRSSRIVVEDASVAPGEAGLVLTFTLPKGSYATALLREVMKVDVDEPLDGPVDTPLDSAQEAPLAGSGRAEADADDFADDD